MKKIILYLLCCIGNLRAQNLLPNASFEQVNICSEYAAPCAPVGWMSVAPEMLRMKYMCDGSSIQGVHHVKLLQEGRENPDSRVYIQTRLRCPLQNGTAYRIRVYMNTENYPLRIGLRFDTNFIFNWQAGCLNVPASVELIEDDVLKKLNRINHSWYILEKTWVATAPATHLIIGNFKAPARQSDNPAFYNDAHLVIDSISITPVDASIRLCPDSAAVMATLLAERHRHSIPESPEPDRPILNALIGACDTLGL